jgi:hypothetical protein
VSGIVSTRHTFSKVLSIAAFIWHTENTESTEEDTCHGGGYMSRRRIHVTEEDTCQGPRTHFHLAHRENTENTHRTRREHAENTHTL